MTRVLFLISVVSGFFALFLLLLAGPSYRYDILALGSAFMLMRWAAYVGLASLVLIIGYGLWQRPRGKYLVVLGVSAVGTLSKP